LYSDALSNSNESMFIEDVINKYSEHLSCKFNEDAFAELAYLINPHVSPARIDPITGHTKVTRGDIDVFFSKETQKFEDVHITMHRYSSNGTAIRDSQGNKVVNIVDPTDIIEQSILLADNSFRKAQYNRYADNIGYMKEVFNSINNNNYNKIVSELLYTPDGETPESGTIIDMVESLNEYRTNIENLVEVFNTSKLESDFNKILTENTLVEHGIRDMLKLLLQLTSYHKSIEMDSKVLAVDERINAIHNKMNLKEIIDIRAISKRDMLNTISNRVLDLKASGRLDSQMTALEDIMSDVKDVIDYAVLVTSENNLSMTDVDNAVKDYNNLVDLYNALFDPYLSEENIKT